MKDNQSNGKSPGTRRARAAWKPSVVAAAVLSVVQACLTIEGRGIEGFILWVLIFFVGYWLLFTFLIWLWQKRKDRM